MFFERKDSEILQTQQPFKIANINLKIKQFKMPVGCVFFQGAVFGYLDFLDKNKSIYKPQLPVFQPTRTKGNNSPNWLWLFAIFCDKYAVWKVFHSP